MGDQQKHGVIRRVLNRLPQPRSWKSAALQLIPILPLCAIIMLLSLQIQPNEFSFMLEQLTTQPLLIVLNYLPVFLIMLFLTALSGNVFYGAAFTELIVCGLSLASRIKVSIRQEPLYPRDLNMFREVGEAVSSYHIDFPMKIIAVLLGIFLILMALGVILPRLGQRPMGLRGPLRWVQCVLSVAVSLALVFTVYNSRWLYTSFSGTHFFNPLGAYNGLGFTYSFCHYLTTNSVDKPEGYNEAEAAAWDSEDLGEAESLPVNVVFFMNETFTDLIDNPVFTYSDAEDPLSFYHSLIAREDVISGHLVVMGLGGGTANTEFDVLTGIQADSLSKGTTVAYRVMDHNIDSLFRLYRSAGYLSSFIHPGHRWFYNRNHILPWLGAESITFNEDLGHNPEIVGGYVSDNYTADLLFEQFEADTADGNMAFNYTTSIQNHMNYTLDKYGEDYPIPPLQCSATLTEEIETQLAVYVEGLRYADECLEKSIHYFEACGKPVIYVFFGDHYPYLGRNNDGFWQLGMEGDNKAYDFSLYTPPYLIWANEEAQEILDWDRAVADLDLSETISASYLGAMVTELTGISDSSPWYTFLNQLRREFPVVWHEEYVDRDGNLYYELEPEDAAKILKWRQWSYYRLMHKKIKD